MPEMTGKQAVVNTTAGTIVIDLRPDLAPNHVGYFMKVAREHAYDGTTFHRVIRMAIVQGGDWAPDQVGTPPRRYQWLLAFTFDAGT